MFGDNGLIMNLLDFMLKPISGIAKKQLVVASHEY